MFWLLLGLAWDGDLDGRKWIQQPPPVSEPIEVIEPEPEPVPLRDRGSIGVVGGEPLIHVCHIVDRSWIDEVVKRRVPQIRHCYERARLLDRNLEADLMLVMTLESDRNALLLRGDGPTSLKRCILDAFDDPDFIEQPGLTTVRYPIRLRPKP